jgi:hypothetical protein
MNLKSSMLGRSAFIKAETALTRREAGYDDSLD